MPETAGEDRCDAGDDPRVTAARALAAGPPPRFDMLLPAGELTRMYHELRRAMIGLLEVIDGCPEEPDEPEPVEYDPGPEVDDEGGMSEYRHQWPDDPV